MMLLLNLSPHVFLSLQCAALASIATLFGAFVAQSLTRRDMGIDWPWLISGGSLSALACLELFPESLSLTTHIIKPPLVVALLLIAGLGYAALEYLKHRHVNQHENRLARIRGSIFIIHSLVDGVAIGVGFSDSGYLGMAMALAIIAHDLSDGFNFLIFLKGASSGAHWPLGWLLTNIMAPLLGALLAIALQPTPPVIGVLLAALAGFFLSISLSVARTHIWGHTQVFKRLAIFALGATLMGSLLLSLR